MRGCTEAATLTASVCAQARWNSGSIFDGRNAADWLLRPRARHAATRLGAVLSVVLLTEGCAAAGAVRGWWGVDAAAPACVQGCEFRCVASPWLGSVGVSACIQLPNHVTESVAHQRCQAVGLSSVCRRERSKLCSPVSACQAQAPTLLLCGSACVRGITQVGLKVCDAWPCNGREE
jgi:hypothetical protein